MAQTHPGTALVTGASSGIARCTRTGWRSAAMT